MDSVHVLYQLRVFFEILKFFAAANTANSAKRPNFNTFSVKQMDGAVVYYIINNMFQAGSNQEFTK